MAIHATSTTVPTAHPRLRGGDASARLLSEADVLALVGNRPEAEPPLSPPAPLPSLTSALSRRRALFGAVALAAAPAAALPALASTIGFSDSDVRLVALADELEALEQTCNAFPSTRARETEFGQLVDGFGPLEERIADTPADSLTGIMAKIRALDVPTTGVFGNPGCHNIFVSITEDIERLHTTGALHG